MGSTFGESIRCSLDYISCYRAAVLGDAKESSISKDAKAKALGIYKKLSRRDILWSAHLLHDIVIVLSRISLTSQHDHCTVSDMYTALSSAKESLTGFITKFGPKLRIVQNISEMQDFRTQANS